MKYVTERNEKCHELLEAARANLPAFCNAFFLGIAQTTQPLTRLNYAYDLGVFFKFLSSETDTFQGKKISEFKIEDLTQIETLHVELFAEAVRKNNGEKGTARKLSCLRSFFSYFFKKGDIEKNIMPLVNLPKIHDKNIIRLDDDEARNIVTVARDGVGLTLGQRRFFNKNGYRDTVILTFFLSTGCRVSELVGLNIGDIDLKNSSFRVVRKGGNESVLYMTKNLCDVMRAYIPEDAEETAPLFRNIQGDRLGVRAVQNLVKKYASTAAPLKKISPHKLRSTFGTNLYRATGDIYAVADVLGHRNVNTTRKHYAAITEETRKSAMEEFEKHEDGDNSDNNI